ncbi:WD40 repeat domain-containing protein [Streptomyces sp. NPDC001507]|uniref:WD40 repeat domain-containing protein n=1 Tax=Streptomyces sp. NPDC001507 TaxID=3364579 RepID=UPI0036D036B5
MARQASACVHVSTITPTRWVVVLLRAIAPDGTWLTTASGDGRVRIWDRASGTCSATLTGHTSSVLSVAIAPDGAWLATGGHDRTVRIWDVAGQRTVGVARADGSLFATRGTGRCVRRSRRCGSMSPPISLRVLRRRCRTPCARWN